MSNRTERHDKIQQIAAKIIDLNNDFSNTGKLTKIDIDLLRKYTQDLYEEVLSLEPGGVETPKVVPTPPETHAHPPVKQENHTEPLTTDTAPVPPAPKEPYTPPAPPAPVKEPVKEPTPEPPKVEAPAPPPVVVEAPVEKPQPPVVEPTEEKTPPQPPVEPPTPPAPPTPPPPPVVEKKEEPVAKAKEEPKKEPSLNERHQPAEKHDLASKMQQTPIHDLKKAISINKKFEFINQLYKGDHEAYAKSIHYINGLSNGAEANTFFNNLKKQFGWDEENKLYLELADMVKRRFM